MKKTIIYYLIELIFALTVTAYLLTLRNQFFIGSSYEQPLFVAVVLLTFLLAFVLGPFLGKVLAFGFTGLISLYFITQTIYNRGFEQYYRLSTAISLFDELMGVKSSAAELIRPGDFTPLIILSVITAVFLIVYFAFERKLVSFKTKLILPILSLFLILPIGMEVRAFDGLIVESAKTEDVFQLNLTDYYIYSIIPTTNQFVAKFGLLPFLYRDANALMEENKTDPSDNIKIAEYLSRSPEHLPNEMTGLLKDKNVLFVQAESLVDAAITPELTPTLYKMKTEGINFSEFSTPLLTGSTSDSEYMAITSTIPDSDGYSISYKYPYNSYGQTLASVFNDAGYRTVGYHNLYGTYYNRTVMFPGFGFQYFMDRYELGYTEEKMDDEVAKTIVWNHAGEKRFMAYWVTFSGHQPYSLDGQAVDPEDVKRIRELYPDLDDKYTSYLAKTMNLDRAMYRFIDTMTFMGEVDDLAVVVFGDHFAKGIDLSKGGDFWTQTGREYYSEAANTDLFIYSTNIEPVTVTKKATLLDLLPTVSNIMGIDYDEKRVLGRDIFDEEYNGFYFNDWGRLETGDFVVDDSDGGVLHLKPESKLTMLEAQTEAEYYFQKRVISKLIIKNDYFKEH